jgi:hypothetical protein
MLSLLWPSQVNLVEVEKKPYSECFGFYDELVEDLMSRCGMMVECEVFICSQPLADSGIVVGDLQSGPSICGQNNVRAFVNKESASRCKL